MSSIILRYYQCTYLEVLFFRYEPPLKFSHIWSPSSAVSPLLINLIPALNLCEFEIFMALHFYHLLSTNKSHTSFLSHEKWEILFLFFPHANFFFPILRGDVNTLSSSLSASIASLVASKVPIAIVFALLAGQRPARFSRCVCVCVCVLHSILFMSLGFRHQCVVAISRSGIIQRFSHRLCGP